MSSRHSPFSDADARHQYPAEVELQFADRGERRQLALTANRSESRRASGAIRGRTFRVGYELLGTPCRTNVLPRERNEGRMQSVRVVVELFIKVELTRRNSRHEHEGSDPPFGS